MSLTDQLTDILTDLQGVWSETSLLFGAIILLILGLTYSSNWLIKSVFFAVLISAFSFSFANDDEGALLLKSLYLSKESVRFGMLFMMVAVVLLIFPRDKKHSLEFYFFILSMLAGSLFMMKANSLLVVYLSIELVSFTSYILTNFSFKKVGFEAGIKYLLFGAISSAVMLFGLGLIYGIEGAFYLSDISQQWVSFGLSGQVGLVMLLMGVFFKISIVPSHLWVPATYQAAPPDATAFMSIVPKLAGILLLKRIMATGHSDHWMITLILGLGMLTIVIGTLGAFQQTNARRMVSFGAIAHSGFLLPFAIISGSASEESFWWYAVAYAIMNLAVFYLLDQYERKNVNTVFDYSSSGKAVWMGTCFTLVLISLVGLPPLAGFMAKFFLFSVLWESYLSADWSASLWYLIVAVLATVGSLFFYFRIPKQIFLSSGEDNTSVNFSLTAKIIATLFSIGLLLLFFAPKLVIVMQQLLNNVHE